MVGFGCGIGSAWVLRYCQFDGAWGGWDEGMYVEQSAARSAVRMVRYIVNVATDVKSRWRDTRLSTLRCSSVKTFF